MASPIRLNGAKLAEARVRAGLTQTALARRVGVNVSNLSRFESGARFPAPSTLVELGYALAVDLDAITDRVTA